MFFLHAVIEDGDLLRPALHEAARLAGELRCGIEFDWHGQRVWILPGMDPDTQYAVFFAPGSDAHGR